METLIRLATAHAKARLSPKVTEDDAKEAEVILRFALFKEVVKRKKTRKNKKRRLNAGGAADGESDESGDESESEDEEPATRMSMPPQQVNQPPPMSQRREPSVPLASMNGQASSQTFVNGEDSQETAMEDDTISHARSVAI